MEDLSSPDLVQLPQETIVKEVEVSKDDPTMAPSGKNIGTKIRKKRSKVWNLFEALPIVEGEKKIAKCKKYGVIYISKSKYGTGNMLTHMKTCLKTSHGDINQLLLVKSENTLLTHSPKFDLDTFRGLLVEAIIKHNLPFSFVEYK
ncbi:hypothetical protein LguiA_006680 [Lonicera macranthoides]